MKFEPALEQEWTCRGLALERMTASIRHYGTMDLADDDKQAMAAIIADILHYCNHHKVDFQSLVVEAELYIAEDESVDAELTRGNYND